MEILCAQRGVVQVHCMRQEVAYATLTGHNYIDNVAYDTQRHLPPIVDTPLPPQIVWHMLLHVSVAYATHFPAGGTCVFFWPSATYCGICHTYAISEFTGKFREISLNFTPLLPAGIIRINSNV